MVSVIEKDGMIETVVYGSLLTPFLCPQCQTWLFTVIGCLFNSSFAETWKLSYQISYQDVDVQEANCFIDKDGRVVMQLLHL